MKPFWSNHVNDGLTASEGCQNAGEVPHVDSRDAQFHEHLLIAADDPERRVLVDEFLARVTARSSQTILGSRGSLLPL